MALFDSPPNLAFYAKDTRSRFVRVNIASVSAHGVKDEEKMLGRDDRAYHPPALAGLFSTHFNRRSSSSRCA